VKGQANRTAVRVKVGADADPDELRVSRSYRHDHKRWSSRARRRLGAVLVREELDLRGQQAAVDALCHRLGFDAEAT